MINTIDVHTELDQVITVSRDWDDETHKFVLVAVQGDDTHNGMTLSVTINELKELVKSAEFVLNDIKE